MYIDPNTGGMLFQVLTAVFVVASGVILVFSSRLKMLWARLKRRRTPEVDLPTEDAPSETGSNSPST